MMNHRWVLTPPPPLPPLTISKCGGGNFVLNPLITPPILFLFSVQVEEIVAHTATGCSPVLAGYYHYWERCLYNAIVQMVLRSMAALMGFLQCKDGPPVFKVSGRVGASFSGALSSPDHFPLSPIMSHISSLVNMRAGGGVAQWQRVRGVALPDRSGQGRSIARWRHSSFFACHFLLIIYV